MEQARLEQAKQLLYSGTQCAEIDRAAVAQWGFDAAQLMAAAGRAAFAALQTRWPEARRLCVCAGVGNNAGDAYEVAELAHGQNLAVTVLQLEGRTLTGIAGAAQQRATAAGVEVIAMHSDDMATAAPRLAAADVVVDGLLGIGLANAPRPLFAELIAMMNGCGRPILALDVPSGMNADASAPHADVVTATHTMTFVVDKLCLHTGVGAALAGSVAVDNLGLPARLLGSRGGVARAPLAPQTLPPLAPAAYKHGRGHVVVVGGDLGMSGAALLTAEAALRAGAGLVSVITRGTASAGMLARVPELMVLDAARWPAVLALLARATVVVCGPGLGQAPWGRALFEAVLQHASARVFDADALNLLAAQGPSARSAGAVLTPHSGEAARLLGCSSRAVEQDRLASVQALADRFEGIAVLKGPGSLVAGKDWQSLCPHGNPGMATAGMGDVLAGVTGAVLAQALAGEPDSAPDPACVAQAVAWHGAAADAAAQRLGLRSLVASDVIAALPEVSGE